MLSPLHTDDAKQLAEWNNDLSFSILMGHAVENAIAIGTL
jgi:hypothetical protein